jgi:hypothetical protein
VRPGDLDFILDRADDLVRPIYWLSTEFSWRGGIVPIALNNVRFPVPGDLGPRDVRLYYAPRGQPIGQPYVVITQSPIPRSGTTTAGLDVPWRNSPCVASRSLDLAGNDAAIYTRSESCETAPNRFAARLRSATSRVTVEITPLDGNNPYCSEDAIEFIVRSLGPRG